MVVVVVVLEEEGARRCWARVARRTTRDLFVHGLRSLLRSKEGGPRGGRGRGATAPYVPPDHHHLQGVSDGGGANGKPRKAKKLPCRAASLTLGGSPMTTTTITTSTTVTIISTTVTEPRRRACGSASYGAAIRGLRQRAPRAALLARGAGRGLRPGERRLPRRRG